MAAARPALASAGLAAVVSASDLHRIRNVLGQGQQDSSGSFSRDAFAASTPALPDSRAKAKELHERSKARASTWTNTLEGSRAKKKKDRQDRLDQQELERQRQDAEEAKLQLDQRKATIDRANKLLSDESDRMKSFHSQMMMCDVLAEREAQVALKDELKKLEQVREDRFLEMEKQNFRKMLEREMKEKETKEELSRIQAVAQKEQLAEYKEKRFREIEDQMLEGELLRRKAIEDLEAEKRAGIARRQTAVTALQETQKANEYLKQIKVEDQLREQRENDKIQEYAVRKEKMLTLRKQKEEEVFRQKQAQRMAMIEAQANRLAAMQNNEEERVARQVKDKEEADERKRVEKEELHQRWQDDIQRSRQAQIDRKRSQRQQEKYEEVETSRFLGEWCKVLDKQEQEEQEARLMAQRKLSQEHKKHVEILRRRREEELRQDLGVAVNGKKALEADVKEFHNYAEECIRSYADEGKNVIPLIKSLREFRKASEV